VTRRLALAALAAVALAAAAPARAAAPVPLPVQLAARAGRLVATVDLSAAFPPALEHEVGNGLTNVVAVYVAVVPAHGGAPALIYGRVVEILFDVWEETYSVTVKDPHVPQGVRLVLPDFAALRRFLSEERDLDLGPSSLLPPRGFVVEARVEVNPVSKEQLQRTREFIASPSGGARGAGGSRSVLGTMASFLLRAPDPGADVVLFRSRPYGPGEVAPR
jgi:phage tail protein X